MNKLFSIGLAFLLVLSTIGVTIHKQYFHGELYSVALFVETDCCCDQDCPCCYEESETIQVSDEFISSTHELDKPHAPESLKSFYENFSAAISQFHKYKTFLKKDKSPPVIWTIMEHNQAFLL